VEALIILTHIAIILLIGMLCSLFAKALKLPAPLILVLVGLFIGSISANGNQLISINQDFVIGLSLLALLMLAFDSVSRFKVSEMSKQALPSLRLINWFLLLSAVVMTFFTSMLFFGGISFASILFSLVFSVMIIETDLGGVLLMFKEYAREKSSKLLVFLETEANLNTPFVVVLPFVILGLIADVDFGAKSAFWAIIDKTPLFIYQLLLGLGVGIMVGVVILKYMKKSYSRQLSPVAIITSVLISYILAEQLGGNGMIAVATMSFLFGNVYVSGKQQLEEFSSMFANALEIMIFIMLGIVVRIPISLGFVLKSLLLFMVFVLIRAAAVHIALKKEDYRSKEKWFISLNMPKGLALAAVALVLATYPYFSLDIVLQLTVMFIIYSLVLSFAVDFRAKKFLHSGTEEKTIIVSECFKSGKPIASARNRKAGSKSLKKRNKKGRTGKKGKARTVKRKR
jgi:NhaP-type Na+/H+ or K+/H+ antiporter